MFPQTYEHLCAESIELEYVETESGDVWAMGLVNARGDILRVVDVDTGELCTLSQAERERVQRDVWARRESEVR